MAETTTVQPPATPVTPAAPVAPAVPSTNFEITADQWKAAGFEDKDIPAAAPPATPVVPATAPALQTAEQIAAALGTQPPTTGVTAVTPPAEEGLNLAALEEPAASTPPAPQYTPEQKILLENPDLARAAVQGANLQNAIQRGDLNSLLTSIQQSNPQVMQALLQTVKQQFLTPWIDEYIATNDPNANPQVAVLKQQLTEIQNRLNARESAEAQTEQQRQHQARLTAVDTEIDRLFDLVRFTKDTDDRSIVMQLIHHGLADNRQVFEQVWRGNMGALRPLFRDVVNRYVQRDSARAEKLRATQQTQAQNKTLPIQTAGVGQETTTSGKDKAFQDAAEWVRTH